MAVPTLAANGMELYYERRGEGPRLLFCNGSGANLETSAPIVDAFAARFDVLAHDQRGLGKTGGTGPFSMAEYAADALALLDALGWYTTRLIGVSFGGMVAQEMAVTWPERVSRLALLCTSPGGGGGGSYPLHELAALSDEERATRYPTLLDTRFTPAWLAAHPSDRAMVEMVAERRRAPASPAAAEGAAAQLEARRGHDVYDRLPRISCPTLVACGRYDGIAPPENSQAIAAQVPRAELRTYDGGHAFFFQDPTVVPEVLDWLAE